MKKSPKAALELFARLPPKKKGHKLAGYEDAVEMGRDKGLSYREIAAMFVEDILPSGSKVTHTEVRLFHLRMIANKNRK
ncbi:hypothetical protein SAMN05444156_2169 [Verrucomicrobium sp. GAS474]|uniref:hypothetical protein n=1 Tax=Verrucomicrobium sp. GAS474 TaxID=1882831 RepID=UPI0008793FC6|nr:hypothetical protein [Verrucomicrobium sp. GAS474]SDU13541.1 hypothetical protein SAMN05444156_2169 [Verrucomicrobium sp. GAS474]